MDFKKLLLCFSLIALHSAKAETPQQPAPQKVSPALIDKAVLDAFEQSSIDQEVLGASTVNNDIAFILSQDTKTNFLVITLRAFINIDEFDKPTERTLQAKTLKDLLVNSLRLKFESEEKRKIKTATGAVLIVGPSPRLFRQLGEQTQCRVTSDDYYNDCLECKLFMNALQHQQLQNKTSSKSLQVKQ